MIHKLLTFLIILLAPIAIRAKSLHVETFEPMPFDLSALTNQKADRNGVPCALIKVTIPDNVGALKFEGNIIDVSNDGSEILAYFSDGTKRITVKADGFNPVDIIFSDYKIYRLISKMVYRLSLTQETASKTAVPEKKKTTAPIYESLTSMDTDPVDEIVENANRYFADKNFDKAVPLLKQAAQLGHPEALLSLGCLYEKGVIVERDTILVKSERLAFRNVQQAAQQGFAPAQKVMSNYYKTGTGCTVNDNQAEAWLNNYRISSGMLAADDEQVHIFVEQFAEYPGGAYELANDLSDVVRYPVEAEENGIQGKTILQFVVEKNGTVGDITIVRSSGNELLDNEAIRCVRQLKKFYPGKNNGIPVRSYFSLPVIFRLED